jgi:hypothetical protein
MTITAAKKRPGVRTFYIESDSGFHYAVTHIRRAGMRRWVCSCPDFFYRRQTKGSYRSCKHIREAKLFCVRSNRTDAFLDKTLEKFMQDPNVIGNSKVIQFGESMVALLRASINMVNSKKEARA